MAGMYYSLQDVVKKLGKNEAAIREMVKEGKLHEYRDGAKIVFKMDEVDAIAAQKAEMDITGSEIELVLDETGEISLDSGAGAPPKKSGGDLTAGLGISGLGDLTSADTNVESAGINVLGETDDEYKLTEDTKAETQALGGGLEDELGDLGDLDADSNLEVGSGSGLLDLSLQADDTSLGAVLDDILPAAVDGEPEGRALQDGMAEEADKIFEESQGSMGVPSPVAAAGAGLPEAPVVAVPIYQPAVAEDGGGAYGVAMFLPLLAAIYAAIVVFAGLRNVVPSVFKGVAGEEFYGLGLIWYIVIVLSVLTLLIVAVSGMSGGKKAKKK
ncbi:MAG TPA: helix-turn-helix domain-containing protein [Anaerohalosphaeraceae bacterium]|jgi:hypothetical protein|nr:helix-turn-helix domain-containing protein [Anaerohalosphaeraceae bacterium]HRT51033.1 helix-turn-helix domain-containing protein [Anaerohalosphaeraceae bacterium]HRT87019.1 helix-turn-helix domain-containing protein [Anaerohalosphaeraceae bacterium]